MLSQIVMVHLKLKLKLTQEGLVPEQLSLFQKQANILCVKGPNLLTAQDGTSRLEVRRDDGGTSSSWYSVEGRGLAWCGIICPERPGLLAQARRNCKNKSWLIAAQNTQRELNTEHSGEGNDTPCYSRRV